MPSHGIALYAKWVNGLYTVRTFTDDAMQSLYTYDGYTGVQKDIEKYALATAPTAPQKDGHVFVGWFYRDGDTEKIFSFTMPITLCIPNSRSRWRSSTRCTTIRKGRRSG